MHGIKNHERGKGYLLQILEILKNVMKSNLFQRQPLLKLYKMKFVRCTAGHKKIFPGQQ
jgi:hypothetical protein